MSLPHRINSDDNDDTVVLDAVVVGLGGVGSFALRALAKYCEQASLELQNHHGDDHDHYDPDHHHDSSFTPQRKMRVVGIERFHRGHSRGSSHGKSRAYRRVYFGNYGPWIKRSIELFQELEEEQRVTILQECGTLVVMPIPKLEPGVVLEGGGNGDADDEVLPSEDQALPASVQKSLENAIMHNIPFEKLNELQLRERFPQFRFPPIDDQGKQYFGLFEPGSGFLRPERAVTAALKSAEESANGSIEIMEHTQVSSFHEITYESGDTIVEVHIWNQETGKSAVLQTKRLLISAGAWTGTLLPQWASHLQVTRQMQGWIDTQYAANPTIYSYGQMPTFGFQVPGFSNLIYGIPCDHNDSRYSSWLKVAIHGRNDPLRGDPSENSPIATPDEIEELRQVARLVIHPRAWRSEHANEHDQKDIEPHSDEDEDNDDGPPLAEIRPCMYTMSPDGNFIMGVPAGYQNVFAIAGLSGHGFKMTPALGEIMCDFALGCSAEDLQRTWGLDFCSPSRFGI